MKNLFYIILMGIIILPTHELQAQKNTKPIGHFTFDGTTKNKAGGKYRIASNSSINFAQGIEKQSLVFDGDEANLIEIDDLYLNGKSDFSVQFWFNSSASDKRFTILSTKRQIDNSLSAQKSKGWSLLSSGGAIAWNTGDGKRRIRYERDNGCRMPLQDGLWHLITMTYDKDKTQVRLYRDGVNFAIYNLNDGDEFDFDSKQVLALGGIVNDHNYQNEILPGIVNGAEVLQKMVQAFNNLGLGDVEGDQLQNLVVDPNKLLRQKVKEKRILAGADSIKFDTFVGAIDFSEVKRLESELMKNPYTVHQSWDFQDVAPLLQIYRLKDGRISIDEEGAMKYGLQEKLDRPDFSIDDLKIWDKVISAEEVFDAYHRLNRTIQADSQERINKLTVGDWNIYHGGIHNNLNGGNSDSRLRIVDVIRESGADVIMMQETYSNGDFIAAELGYYFAASVDWDYLNQGANISVLSRYPIKEIYIPPGASFMNVGALVELSEGQEIYVMSNWYGMNKFEDVFKFHKSRFDNADEIPVLFAGDFNAVPHTDGGESPASVKMLEAGFTDAFRSLYPDVKEYPGYSHRGGVRIDQLYYKGKGLNNLSTKVWSKWPSGFPSDHFLIISEFELR